VERARNSLAFRIGGITVVIFIISGMIAEYIGIDSHPYFTAYMTLLWCVGFCSINLVLAILLSKWFAPDFIDTFDASFTQQDDAE
jgi:hypothetical protein